MLKKTVFFTLALIASSSIYKSSQAFYFMTTDDADMHQKFYTQNYSPTLDKVVDSTILATKKIAEHAILTKKTANNYCQHPLTKQASISICKSCLMTIAISVATKIVLKYLLNDASEETKKCIIDLANKLKIKNPENICIKVLPKFLFGKKGLLGINAMATITEDIMISNNFDEDPLSNESKFVFGHELGHIKHKHLLKINIINNLLYPIIGNTILYILNKYDIYKCEFSIFDSNGIKKHKVILELVSQFAPKIILSLCGFEKQADLESASLGNDVTEGGITLFSNTYNKMSTLTKTTSKAQSLLLLQPHPTYPTRIEYLKNTL